MLRKPEKDGENIPIDEVYRVFGDTTSLADPEYNVFKYHCRKIFCSQWTHSRVISIGSDNFFTDMAVKPYMA